MDALISIVASLIGVAVGAYVSLRVAQVRLEALAERLKGIELELARLQREYVTIQRFELVMGEIRQDRVAITDRLDRLLELFVKKLGG